MATTSSTSSSDWAVFAWNGTSREPLKGCGVDLERPSRFERYVDPNADVWPLVFSERELDHARGLADPKRALCAAFCVKEAFTKALRAPFEYTECELLYRPKNERHDVLLAPELSTLHRISRCEALVRWPSADACLVVVYLYEAT